RFEGADPLLLDAELKVPTAGVDERQRGEQAVHVYGAVGDAAHPGVATQVVDLVEVEGAGNESLERARTPTGDELADPGAERRQTGVGQQGSERRAAQAGDTELLMVGKTGLLQGVGEGVMPDVMQQGREPGGHLLLL